MTRPAYTGYTSAKSLASIRAACDEPLTEKERAPHQEYPPIPKYPPIPPLPDGVPDTVAFSWLDVLAWPWGVWLWRGVLACVVFALVFLAISHLCDAMGYDFAPLWWLADIGY